jgi:hypothetical protein
MKIVHTNFKAGDLVKFKLKTYCPSYVCDCTLNKLDHPLDEEYDIISVTTPSINHKYTYIKIPYLSHTRLYSNFHFKPVKLN